MEEELRTRVLTHPGTGLWRRALVAASAALCAGSPVRAQEADMYRIASGPVEERVADLLARLTLDEKIDLVGGTNHFYIRAVERLGLPAIKMSDGPVGVRNDGPTTAYPAGIALAATWDEDLARRYGAALGRDSRARGVHVLLAPGVNIQRVPQCGRNFEYFGEDPHLAARLAVAYIRALQGQGVAATVKHFAANNHEDDRGLDSSDVDERTLNEIYFPAFRAAVQEAGVWTVMCSYNRLNGAYTSAHDGLLNGVLKRDWGFPGFVMTDWGAAHDTLGCVNGGLDLEMPSGLFMNRTAILALLESGQVAESTIDDKVRRILRVIVAMGWLDRPQQDPAIPLDDPQNAAVALDVARAGIVLLKNRGAMLPLDRARLKTIAVVGPNAEPAVTGGGGSSYTTPFRSVSALQGLRDAAGGAIEIVHIPGPSALVHEGLFRASNYVGKLRAEFFNNKDLAGPPAATREDEQINFPWGSQRPMDGIRSPFSARWSGTIRPPASGEYVFVLKSDDGARLRLDGQPLLDMWSDHGVRQQTAHKKLKAGRTYALELDYYDAGGEAFLQFGWGPVPSFLTADDLRRMRRADAVVVCAGFDKERETEGIDRSFSLPDRQDEVIAAAAEANPRTVVVLNAGAGVDMTRWLDRVPALVQAWYPGQAGGTALAEILFGDVNPSGKLPSSFERRWEDAAAFGHFPAVSNRLHYAEGLFVGYRHFDAKQIEPQFPFGHGLSYTTFRYGNLRIVPEEGDAGTTVAVSFDVENTGKREGADVAQLYVRDLESSVPRPVKELKGFRKIALKPGELRTVTLELDRGAFAYYDIATKSWIVEPGAFEILVGPSSRDLPLRGTCELR